MKNLVSSFFIVSVVCLTGCKTTRVFDQGLDQAVTIYSFPPHAELVVNGEELGRTPITVDLPRKLSHEVILKKEGYKTYEKLLAPSPNGKGDAFIRFGLMEDTGLYDDLVPNPIEIRLEPDVIPDYIGEDRYGEMAKFITWIDGEREAGLIGAVEHKYKIDRVLKHFGAE